MASRLDQLLAEGRSRLLDALARAGHGASSAPDLVARPVPAPAQEAGDLGIEIGGRAHRLRFAGVPGLPNFDNLRGALADALLSCRALANADGLVPCPVLVVSPLSDSMRARLVAYVAAVAPEACFGLVDPGRSIELFEALPHGSGGHRIWFEDRLQQRSFESPVQVAPRPPQPFSDLGQWMLKVWLAPCVQPGWIRAPREPIDGVRALARAAGVSEPSASRSVKQLAERGFVERAGRHLRLVRHASLFQAWAASRDQPLDLPVRFDLPPADPIEALRDQHAIARDSSQRSPKQDPQRLSPRWALGLFSAARLHGAGHVRGAPVHLLHEDPSPAHLAALGLSRVDRGAPYDLLIRRPADPECAFRGSVERHQLPVADGFECYLDLLRHPARGPEQAAELLRQMGCPADWQA
jgi:hypothetical protein